MRNRKSTKVLLLSIILLAAVALLTMTVSGGNLEPASPPGPTMHSLDELFNLTSSLSSGQIIGPLGAANVRGRGYMQAKDSSLAGELSHDARPGWNGVLWAGFSVRVPSSASLASGAHSGRPQCSEFSIIKETDKASPYFFLYACMGKRIEEITIELCRPTGAVYMKYLLQDVVVSAIEPVYSHVTDGEYSHLEKLSFRYGEIELTHIMENGYATQIGWDPAHLR